MTPRLPFAALGVAIHARLVEMGITTYLFNWAPINTPLPYAVITEMVASEDDTFTEGRYTVDCSVWSYVDGNGPAAITTHMQTIFSALEHGLSLGDGFRIENDAQRSGSPSIAVRFEMELGTFQTGNQVLRFFVKDGNAGG